MVATPFDIEDSDLEAAEGVHARNLLSDPQVRADEARFYVLTACSTAGWQWRVAEEGEEPARPPEHLLALLERQRAGQQAQGRSELIGLTARAAAEEETLDEYSPVGPDFAHLFLAAGWALMYVVLVAPQPEVAHLHPLDLLERSFRFGVALRDAQLAYDA